MKKLLLTCFIFLALSAKGQKVAPFVEEFYGETNRGMWFLGKDKNELAIAGEKKAVFNQFNENIVYISTYPILLRYDLENRRLVDSLVISPISEYVTTFMFHAYYFPWKPAVPRSGFIFHNEEKTQFSTITRLRNTTDPTTDHAFKTHINLDKKNYKQEYISIYDSLAPGRFEEYVGINIFQRISGNLAIASFAVRIPELRTGNRRLVLYNIKNNTFKEIKNYRRTERTDDRHTPLKIIPNNKDSSTFFMILRKQNYEYGATYNYLLKMDTAGNEIWKTQLHLPYFIPEPPHHHWVNDPKEYAIQQREDGKIILGYMDNGRWNVTLASHSSTDPARTRTKKDSNGVVLRLYCDETGERWKQNSISGELLTKIADIVDSSQLVNSYNPNQVPAGKILKNGDYIIATTAFNFKKRYHEIFSMRFDSNFELKSLRVLHPFPNRARVREEPWQYAYHGSFISLSSILERDDGSLLYSGRLYYDAKALDNFLIEEGKTSTFIMGTDEYGCMEPGCQEQDTLIAYWEEKLKTVHRAPEQDLNFKIYPNPAQAIFYL
ncbi:MAG: hypothetical protein JJU02_07275, partial [Cryomorphaceae bacterium]|nr:hypothetical protein [Cryomorphaceae bacterium]